MLLHTAAEDVMKKPKGMDSTQAREKVEAGDATLVCAYEDDEKCGRILLDGSTTMRRLKASLKKRSKDEELIFYCA